MSGLPDFPHDATPGQLRAARDRHLAECLQQVMCGDASAFEAFYDATFAYAQVVARRVLRQDDTDDLLADVYFEVWRTAPRFDPARGSAVTWLLTMVHSRALDLLRQRVRHPSVQLAADAPDAESAGADLISAELDPSEVLWRGQCDARLNTALQALGSAERWVLGLAYFRELTHAQIAAATGMPLGTVKSLIHRAQHHLREHFLALQGPAAAAAAPRHASASIAAPGASR